MAQHNGPTFPLATPRVQNSTQISIAITRVYFTKIGAGFWISSRETLLLLWCGLVVYMMVVAEAAE